MEHQTTRNVILITEGSLQSSLLKDVLETKLGINVLLITPENLASPFVRNQSISAIVLDYSVITDEVFARYMEFKTPNLTGTLEILINCDKSISTDELFVWGRLLVFSIPQTTYRPYRRALIRFSKAICGSVVNLHSSTLLICVVIVGRLIRTFQQY